MARAARSMSSPLRASSRASQNILRASTGRPPSRYRFPTRMRPSEYPVVWKILRAVSSSPRLNNSFPLRLRRTLLSPSMSRAGTSEDLMRPSREKRSKTFLSILLTVLYKYTVPPEINQPKIFRNSTQGRCAASSAASGFPFLPVEPYDRAAIGTFVLEA